MTIIGMKELRTNTEEITRRVQAGESFTVVNRSTPVFNITPVADSHQNSTELNQWLDSYMEKNHDLMVSLVDK